MNVYFMLGYFIRLLIYQDFWLIRLQTIARKHIIPNEGKKQILQIVANP